MSPSGSRIKVTGTGETERFTVIEFPEELKGPGHLMTTSRQMTETEFRASLAARDIDESIIEETIADARAYYQREPQADE